MLKKERQRNYFQERWHNAFVHFDLFAKRTNEHDLHRLRVELKKIKALLRLHEDMKGKVPRARDMKLFRELFSHAGEIRNTQVGAQLVKQHRGGTPAFFAEQRKLVGDKSKEFVKEMRNQMDKLGALNVALWKNFRDRSDRDILGWYEKKVQELSTYFSPRLKVKQLHEARKLIKRLLYSHDVLNKKLRGQLHLDTEYLHDIETVIGKWHDNVVTHELLQKQSPLHKATLRKLTEQKQKLTDGLDAKTRHFKQKINLKSDKNPEQKTQSVKS